MGYLNAMPSLFKINKKPVNFLIILLLIFIQQEQQQFADATIHRPNSPRALRSEKSQLVQFYKAPRPNGTTFPIKEKEITFVVLLPLIESDNKNDCIMPKVLAVLELAIKHVQNQLGFKDGNVIDFTVISRDTNCSSIYGPIGFFEIYTNRSEVNAVFGLSCEYVLAPVSRYAGIWEVPVLTTGGNANDFNKKAEVYPTLTRLKGAQVNNLGNAVRAVLDHFNWTRTGMMYQNQDVNEKGNSVCFFCIVTVFNYINKTSVFEYAFSTQTDYAKLLTELSTSTRVVIMCADPQSIRKIMLTAEKLNMIDSGEYVFINIELFSRVPHITSQPWYDKNDTDENNERAKKAYTAMLTVTPKQPNDDAYTKVSNDIKNIAEQKYNYTFHESEPISAFVTSFYDGVLLYAKALNDSISDDPSVLTRPINGTDMVRRMWNRSFTGITGNVTIDGNGDRISAYSLLDMNPETGRFEIVAHFLHNRLEMVPDKPIHWAGDRTEPPPDMPLCGYDNTLCPDTSLPGYAILSIVLAFLVLVMIVCFAFGYRHYKAEAAINSMTWKVSIDDVMFSDAGTRFKGSFYSLVRQNSQVSLISDDIASFNEDRQMYIPVGVYRGLKVAIKSIDVQQINLTRSLMLELKRMKDLQHNHLVKFYGACLDSKRSFLLTEYCPKGSLQDILENEQFQLDGMFKLSLMHDIVRGMQFLHASEIRSHGNLKSSNCVVDSRFVLKVSDFGLHTLRSSKLNRDSDVENCQSHAHWSKLLWTAPELLRMEHNRPAEGTQKGDVYSFGIIVHEIATRQGPFFLGKIEQEKSPEEIIHLVKGYPILTEHPFRPNIEDNNDTSDDIKSLMTKCWAEDPTERPDFNMLKTTIRKINKDNETGNIVDNLLKRMEQYANNLEELVEERTQDYLEEKKKCEKLLYQLLPQSVAAQLISGQPVVAETFDQVTIYFSDIVGFTAISAESTPMEVVQFLNDLYTCFDSIVENFDVYKVETIGDAYMVVSGLPVRNGNVHAREIARLALALLEAVHSFKIHHRPNDRLKLRIGLHTGACVAGVVGLKMPRYCLFGDTVNTASRMESNGEALRIHISENTKQALDEFGTFITTKRGHVPMKGKGEMLTYWLEGEVPRPNRPISPNKLMLSRRFSLKQPQRHVNSIRQHLDVPPTSIGGASLLQRSNTTTPVTSQQHNHNKQRDHSPQQNQPQPQPQAQSKETTPDLRVKRKISSSSPKLNGNEFKTEDFPYYLELHQAKEQSAKLKAQSIDRHSLHGKDSNELVNFRLPLASSLKNHNNSTHPTIKALTTSNSNSASNSTSNLNGILQPARNVRMKASPTISSLVTGSRMEMDTSSLGSGIRIKFSDNDVEAIDSSAGVGSGLVTKTYTVNERDEENDELIDRYFEAPKLNRRNRQQDAEHDSDNDGDFTSKTHLLENSTKPIPTILKNHKSTASSDGSSLVGSLGGGGGGNVNNYTNNIIKAKNFKNLFQNSSNNLVCVDDDCILNGDLTAEAADAVVVVTSNGGNGASSANVLANNTLTQPLLAKINS